MNMKNDANSTEEKSAEITIESQRTVTFAGPLPPPQILRQYGEIGSTYPERIFAMAEKEQISAHEFQREAVSIRLIQIKNQENATKRGQYLGAIIALFFLLGAVYTAYIGHDYVAITMVGLPFMGMLTVMITGRHNSK